MAYVGIRRAGNLITIHTFRPSLQRTYTLLTSLFESFDGFYDGFYMPDLRGGLHPHQLGSRDLCSDRLPNFILVSKEAQGNFSHISRRFNPHRKVFHIIFAIAKKCGGRPPLKCIDH